jgi:hypothetical protein
MLSKVMKVLARTQARKALKDIQILWFCYMNRDDRVQLAIANPALKTRGAWHAH